MWRAALASFLSRWVLVSCAITWMLNGWGGPVAASRGGGARGGGRGGREEEEPGRDGRDARQGRDALERELGLEPEPELGEG